MSENEDVTTRKLASVRRVSEIRPIEGADNIELALVDGWQCVVKKGVFQAGDLGVYLEIDSIPPDDEIFRFLWAPKVPIEGQPIVRPPSFRIKTIKLRGQLSQGLLLPFTEQDFGRFLGPADLEDFVEGDDLTVKIGVTKYEPPLPSGGGFHSGQASAPFPGFLKKTDETRVQNVLRAVEELRGQPYVITLKCDGTSSTFAIDPATHEFLVCGRNYVISPDLANVYWQVAKKYAIEEFLRDYPGACLALQGEIVGPGIQKNRLGLKEVELRVFDIFDVRAGAYCTHAPAPASCLVNAGIPTVPVIERGDDFQHTQESLLALAEGYYEGTKNEREGLVVRALDETLYSPAVHGRLSFKVISNRFLLKGGD